VLGMLKHDNVPTINDYRFEGRRETTLYHSTEYDTSLVGCSYGMVAELIRDVICRYGRF
jgi:hypothetical protein